MRTKSSSPPHPTQPATLNIISRLIGVPAEFIIRAIAQLTGNGRRPTDEAVWSTTRLDHQRDHGL
jgi:hypothetical protein